MREGAASCLPVKGPSLTPQIKRAVAAEQFDFLQTSQALEQGNRLVPGLSRTLLPVHWVYLGWDVSIHETLQPPRYSQGVDCLGKWTHIWHENLRVHIWLMAYWALTSPAATKMKYEIWFVWSPDERAEKYCIFFHNHPHLQYTVSWPNLNRCVKFYNLSPTYLHLAFR